MRPFSIIYHCCLNLNPDHAINIVLEQAHALKQSGLMDQCQRFIVGLNGDDPDLVALSMIVDPKAEIFLNPKSSWTLGEVPTLSRMRSMLPQLQNQNVLYLHMKGLSYPGTDPVSRRNNDWRRKMQDVVIGQWEECVKDLAENYDTSGWCWIYDSAGKNSYWAGNFWWSRSEFLSTLPELLKRSRYDAEVWIGYGNNKPKARYRTRSI